MGLEVDSARNVYVGGYAGSDYATIKYSPPLNIFLVHGWRPKRDKYDGSIAVWNEMKEWFEQADMPSVWTVDNLGDCGYPGDDPHFAASAESLSAFIDTTEQNMHLSPNTDFAIIAHSLGGLTSRRYIEEQVAEWKAAGKVKQLIILASPNAGLGEATVLGNWAIAIATFMDWLTCRGGALVKAASPVNMQQFNHDFGDRGTTKYAAIAGNSPPCWPIFAKCPHDDVFTVSSVLLGDLNLDYACEAVGAEYAHKKITKSSGLFDEVILPLLQEEIPTGSMCADGSKPFADVISNTSTLDFLHLSIGICDSASWTEESVLMEVGDSAEFVIYGLAGDLEVILEDPSGFIIDSTIAIGDPENYLYSNVLGLVSYGISNPQSGVWSVKVRAVTMLDTIAPYLLIADVKNSIGLTASIDTTEYLAGSTIAFTASVIDGGIPVPGCSVSVRPVYGDEAILDEFVLFDDGLHDDGMAEDGIYGGSFGSTTDCGLYGFQVMALGSIPASGDFSRFVGLEAWIKADSTVTCGDANSDDDVNVGDAVFLINYVFKGGPAPNPICVGDANGDLDINIGDAVYLI
ncbi:MAG: alpha/beta fold hydrolase, partial [Planctomycetota bacterium]